MAACSKSTELVKILIVIFSLSCLVNHARAVPKLPSVELGNILKKGGLEGFIRDQKKSGILLEFYSEMCGSCKAFTPKLEALHKKITADKEDLPVYKVNIDDKEGMELANQQNALEDGIPNLRVYTLDTSDKLQYKDLIENEQRMDDSYDSPKKILSKVKTFLSQKNSRKTDL